MRGQSPGRDLFDVHSSDETDEANAVRH